VDHMEVTVYCGLHLQCAHCRREFESESSSFLLMTRELFVVYSGIVKLSGYSYIQNDRPLLKKYTHCGTPTFDF
jgi:hypothetical protein